MGGGIDHRPGGLVRYGAVCAAALCLSTRRRSYPSLPLAPSATLVDRFVAALADVLTVQGARRDFVEAETAEMGDWRMAKTANRSVAGIMTEFTCRPT